MAFCTACSKEMSSQAAACPACGHPTALGQANGKSKVTAGILALLLGGLGVHKFYRGEIGMGVLYLVFCWTFVPSIVAFIEGIIYLTQTDEAFARSIR